MGIGAYGYNAMGMGQVQVLHVKMSLVRVRDHIHGVQVQTFVSG